MDNQKISTYEAISLILIVVLSHLLLNIPQTIINTSGSSSLLNVIYVSVAVILITILVVKLMKPFPNSDLIDISHYLGGKILKSIIGTILIVYILFIAGILLRNAVEALKIIYYFNFRVIFVSIFFIITPLIANIFGEKAIIKCNLIITPVIIIVMLIAFMSVIPLLVWQRIFPVLGYGFDSTFGFNGFSNIFAFNGLLIIMLIVPLLSKPQEFKKISITSIIITAIILFLFVLVLLLGFPFILSVESIAPIYLIVVNTQLGAFLQRPEALFIFIWIMFFMSYLNIMILLSLRIFRKVTKIKSSKTLAYTFSTILFVLTFIPPGITEIRFLENTVYKYITIFITFIIGISILIVANIKYKILKFIHHKKRGVKING